MYKYEKEMQLLFKIVETAIRDHRETAFNHKDISRVVLSKSGQGAFLDALSSEEKERASAII